MIKSFSITSIAAIGGAIALSAFMGSNLVRPTRLHPQLMAFMTMPGDTLPRVKLPPGVDPNGPDWKGIDLEPKAQIKPLTPAQEASRFLLPPGYKMTPILTDPVIQQPAAINFDANGRMYVLELRTYMLDADAKGELAPTSRISRWEDKNNDGVYESGTTFVDNLIFPRFVLPYGKDCVLTMESDADNVYKYTDTNGDGKADKKELFTTKFGRSGNVEHQQSFMFWGMDNWLYSTYNAFRVRETPNGVVREKTGTNRAAWGVTQDEDGKVWFQGGASGLPGYFQFPIHYGNIDVPAQLTAGLEIPWGAAIKIADMQGGMDEIRQPDGSLNHTTGGAGNDVFRGDRLPAALKGQYFYGEVVARIVRQINPEKKEGLTYLHNVYQDQKSEFIRSTDPLFRPVDMTTAPDGTMYITDMYHGIIQEGEWTPPGSYLRTKIDQYGLDKMVNMGRIWRLTYEGTERDKTKPNMYAETSAQVVKHLTHPNGWWRETAQQMLVQRKDLTVVPQLTAMALSDKNVQARIHALWTLEGMGALKTDVVQKVMKDANPRLRIQALRAGETLYKAGDKSLEASIRQSLVDANTDVQIQAMLTAKFLKVPEWEAGLKAAMASSQAAGVKLVGQQSLTPPAAPGGGGGGGAVAAFTVSQRAQLERGATIYNELCSQCHGDNGQGTPAGAGQTIAPAFAGSSRIQAHPDYAISVVLRGLEGPIEGKNYAGGLMVSMKDQSDEWIADVLSYIRANYNSASFVSAKQVANIRQKTTTQTKAYQYAQVSKITPHEVQASKATASNTYNARIGGNISPMSAFNYEGWSTGGRQSKGMWFQLEFPQEVALNELTFVSPGVARRGGPPPAPAGQAGQPAPAAQPQPGAVGGAPAGQARNAFVQRPALQVYPRAYVVEASSDGQTWREVASEKGADGENIVLLKGTKAKFLKVRLTEDLMADSEDAPWSMQQMKVYAQ